MTLQQSELPSAVEVDDVGLVSVAGISSLLGISTHALHMRLARNHDSVPPPDRHLEGCQVWFATHELAAALGVTDQALWETAVR